MRICSCLSFLSADLFNNSKKWFFSRKILQFSYRASAAARRSSNRLSFEPSVFSNLYIHKKKKRNPINHSISFLN